MSALLRSLRLDGSGVILLLILPLLLALGFWQLQRAEEKQSLQRKFLERSAAAPIDLRSLRLDRERPEDLDGLRVFLRGHYDNERVWFLDNRMHQRRIGFEAITPFRLAGGLTALVNRGWRVGDPARRRAPELGAAPERRLQLNGRIYQPRGRILLLAPEPRTRSWPKLIQRIDMERMREEAGGEVFPLLVRLDPGQPGSGPSDWRPAPPLSAERHQGYALTWFTLAAALALLQAFRFWRPAERRE